MPRSLSPTSFEALLVAQTATVTRRLRSVVGDLETAEDLCQEALSRAWRGAPRDADPDRLRAWLLRTARNLAVDERSC
jgi:DNA-directed RNA polymerase specialized sigma24 family protein